MSEVQRYQAATCDCGDTREPELDANGAWVRNADYAQLQQQVGRLTQGQAEGNDLLRMYKELAARLSAPFTEDDYETMFMALNAANNLPGKPMRGLDVFNAIITSRLAPPATGGK